MGHRSGGPSVPVGPRRSEEVTSSAGCPPGTVVPWALGRGWQLPKVLPVLGAGVQPEGCACCKRRASAPPGSVRGGPGTPLGLARLASPRPACWPDKGRSEITWTVQGRKPRVTVPHPHSHILADLCFVGAERRCPPLPPHSGRAALAFISAPGTPLPVEASPASPRPTAFSPGDGLQ